MKLACGTPHPWRASSISSSHLPTIHAFRFLVDAGGLMSYGATQAEIYSIAADQAAKMLQGARRADQVIE